MRVATRTRTTCWVSCSLGSTKPSAQEPLAEPFVILCFVIGAAGRINAASTWTNHPPNTSPGFNSVFAIADFDGDSKPDLATVEIENSGSSSITKYSIRSRLTLGASQNFGVSAPAGGLQIVARDVNGDDALDLLVSTAWLHQEIAVLLNDGHGNFTLAEPAAFPNGIWKSETVCDWGATPLCDSAALMRSEYSAEELGARNQFHCLQSQPGRDSLPVPFGKSPPFFFSPSSAALLRPSLLRLKHSVHERANGRARSRLYIAKAMAIHPYAA